jgi:hypothetical protein
MAYFEEIINFINIFHAGGHRFAWKWIRLTL